MWRPEGWENPYKDIMNPAPGREGVILRMGWPDQERAFEAGADAMYEPAYQKGKADGKKELLKALIKTGKHSDRLLPLTYEQCCMVLGGHDIKTRLSGTLVFIPDEERKTVNCPNCSKPPTIPEEKK